MESHKIRYALQKPDFESESQLHVGKMLALTCTSPRTVNLIIKGTKFKVQN